MKKILSLTLFMNISGVMAQEILAADACFSEYSGAASVECLEKFYKSLNQELEQLNRDVLVSLEDRDKKDIITSTHYESAVSAFKRSILDFKLYRESACNFSTYYSGAVASGYHQVLYKCLISHTEIHNQVLRDTLER